MKDMEVVTLDTKESCTHSWKELTQKLRAYIIYKTTRSKTWDVEITQRKNTKRIQFFGDPYYTLRNKLNISVASFNPFTA